MSTEGYDPFYLGDLIYRNISSIENSSEFRRYYRFRFERWYGGVVTGEVIGCNLVCKFCWAWPFKSKFKLGKLLSPHNAFLRIDSIARKRGVKLCRLSGGEPTLTYHHILQLNNYLNDLGYGFILETNGLLIGKYRQLARDLSRYNNIVVRVSFKGTTPEEFSKLTGAKPLYFEYQFKALENLVSAGLKAGKEVIAAVMVSFSPSSNIAKFILRLAEIDEDLVGNIDWEIVKMYPHVKKLLNACGLRPLRYI